MFSHGSFARSDGLSAALLLLYCPVVPGSMPLLRVVVRVELVVRRIVTMFSAVPGDVIALVRLLACY